ncbi:MAG TPA: hypothetical protein VGH20_14905 [Myxococcales bacterium]|jgi:hypothetical protein
MEDRFWWPLDLSAAQETAMEDFRCELVASGARLDHAAASAADDALCQAMASHLEGILERDSLPHLGHVVNGWGDAKSGGRRVLDAMELFVQRDGAGRPFILQCDPEGEFHPWQSLAYSVMAGVAPGRRIPPGDLTLEGLAANCRSIQTKEGRELGHLLYALPQLPAALRDPRPFSMDGELLDLAGLVERGIEAHYFGSFMVCRKFHLTEGLCAVAALVPQMAAHRDEAQGFLDGQLDMLLVLGLVLREARAVIEGKQDRTALLGFREALALGEEFENHCYYAGHLFELAALCAALGYRVEPAHWSAMAFIAGELNELIPGLLPASVFDECFLHFGHYRRGLTLLLEIDRAGPAALGPAQLSRFTVDFDALPRRDWRSSRRDLPGAGVYRLAPAQGSTRPGFAAAVGEYARLAPAGLSARGKGHHFRRMSPPSWPRSVHYELLDYGGEMGAEIHLESEDARSLASDVQALVPRVRASFPGRRVEWDGGWSKGRGRLRVLFEAATPPEEVAAGMRRLMDATLSNLDQRAGALLLSQRGDGLGS